MLMITYKNRVAYIFGTWHCKSFAFSSTGKYMLLDLNREKTHLINTIKHDGATTELIENSIVVETEREVVDTTNGASEGVGEETETVTDIRR